MIDQQLRNLRAGGLVTLEMCLTSVRALEQGCRGLRALVGADVEGDLVVYAELREALEAALARLRGL